MNKTLFSIALIFICVNCTSISHANVSRSASVCGEALKQGDYHQALEICEKQLALLSDSDQETDKVYLLFDLVDIYHALGDSENETLYLKQIEQHPLFSANPEFSYRWQRNMGQKFYFANDFLQAQQHLNQALAIALQQNNLVWISKSHNDVGLVESKLNNFKASLSHYQKSLAIKTEFGDLYPIGTTLNNLGLIHLKMEDKENAVKYYEKALTTFLDYTQQADFDQRVLTNIAHLYEDLAVAYSQTNNIDKQHFYLEKTIETIQLKSSARQQARALVNVAKIQIENAKFESARVFLEKAILLQNKHALNLKSEINFQMARLFQLTEDKDKAISYANIGLVSAQENADLMLISQLYELLSQLYKATDTVTAFHYFELFHQSREQYLSHKFDSEFKTIQFEIEKQQIESDLVREQLNNEQSKNKIQQLTSWVLLVVLLLIMSVGFSLIYLVKKRREKQALLQNIAHHKQQLLILDDKIRNLNQHSVVPAEDVSVKNDLRETLVCTMLEAVSIWEGYSGKNRVELAEKSKIWTVSVDEGTLRTRSLDKYLSIDKMPLNPRWRNVVRTCHFILSHDDLADKDRQQMNSRLNYLLSLIKELSLESSDKRKL